MPATAIEEIQKDDLAMSVAKALASANDAAVRQGTDPANCLVTISEETSTNGRLWRINYGARNYVNRRGGDLIVIIDEKTGKVQRILRGQ